jgi:hypothetical protein
LFGDADELLEAVQRVLDGFKKMTLQAVFLKWVNRLEK